MSTKAMCDCCGATDHTVRKEQGFAGDVGEYKRLKVVVTHDSEGDQHVCLMCARAAIRWIQEVIVAADIRMAQINKPYEAPAQPVNDNDNESGGKQ